MPCTSVALCMPGRMDGGLVVRQTVVAIPLELAVLCESCRQVSNSTGETCNACAATGSLMSLARVFGRASDGNEAAPEHDYDS
jgi:hypothetical protein